MPLIPIENIGKVGMVRDVEPDVLPPEAWSDARNVRFRDAKGVKFKGEIEVFGTPAISPYFALGVPGADDFLWLYAGLTSCYSWDGSSHQDITRASGAYNATVDKPWTGGLLGGIPVINQPGDVPQMWNPAVAGGALQDLSNWPAGTTARVVKPFKEYLVALNVTRGGSDFVHMVKWSHPADPGTVPVSWDETDETRDAGEYDLTDTHSGQLLDGMPLRDINILYKESSTWGMQYIGGQFIFRFFKISGESGILSTHCVDELGDGRRHIVATGDDIIVHDGQRIESIANRRVRNWLSNTIDPDNYANSFMTTRPDEPEALFCFPEKGQTWPNLALVWNWRDSTLTTRDLPGVAYMAPGVITENEPTDTWDGGPDVVWEADDEVWGQRTYNANHQELLMCDADDTKLLLMNSGEQFNGADMTSYLERRGLALAGVDRMRQPVVNPAVRKLVTEVWPRARGGKFNVRVGSHDTPQGDITWQTPQEFDPETMEKLDVCAQGKYIAVRFEATTDEAWELHSYGLNIEQTGRY